MSSFFDEINNIAAIVIGKKLPSKNEVIFDDEFNRLLSNSGIKEFFINASSEAKAEMLAFSSKENFNKLCSWINGNDFAQIIIKCNLDQLRVIFKKINIFNESSEDILNDDFKNLIASFPLEKKMLVSSFLEDMESKDIPRAKQLNVKEIISSHNKILDENKTLKDEYKKAVDSLNEKINQLETKNAEIIQKRIDDNLSDYVADSVSSLKAIEDKLKAAAGRWSFISIIILTIGFSAGICFSLFGYAFGPDLKDLKWPELLIFSIKGIFIVSAFVAAAGYSFMKSNAFTHEAIIVSNRAHAIQFGKLYLEIYGNTVERSEMQKIFENWNISSDTAFLMHKTDKSESVKFDALLDSLKKVKELIPSIGKE